jgi:hypothetical protein
MGQGIKHSAAAAAALKSASRENFATVLIAPFIVPDPHR